MSRAAGLPERTARLFPDREVPRGRGPWAADRPPARGRRRRRSAWLSSDVPEAEVAAWVSRAGARSSPAGAAPFGAWCWECEPELPRRRSSRSGRSMTPRRTPRFASPPRGPRAGGAGRAHPPRDPPLDRRDLPRRLGGARPLHRPPAGARSRPHDRRPTGSTPRSGATCSASCWRSIPRPRSRPRATATSSRGSPATSALRFFYYPYPLADPVRGAAAAPGSSSPRPSTSA